MSVEAIRIGLTGAFSGPHTTHTAQMKWGALLATREWESRHASPVRVIVGDEQAEAEKAPTVAKHLIDEQVQGVIGHFSSGCALAAAPLYREAGIPLLAPASTHPDLSQWDHIFRLCARDDQVSRVMGEWAARHFHPQRVGLLDDGSVYGKTLMDYTFQTLTKLGISSGIRLEWPKEDTANGKDSLCSLIEQADPEVILFGGRSRAAADMTRTLRQQGINLPLVFGDDVLNAEFLDQTAEASRNVWIVGSIPPSRNGRTASFFDAYRREVGTDPGFYAASTYLATEILLQALVQDDWADKGYGLLQARTWETLLGEQSFDADGNLRAVSLGLWKVEPGRILLSDRFEL
ncbi:branched-chain amino acid ABC transporter substrate-binding protein [Salinithrix halophila]|uniref:Branched-chain amino acid ABC transporter substrate-binding protein n=1 Tax=Salinithrix halophila TaxID=1485204 RepID=A0ABV8JCP4_9BACL